MELHPVLDSRKITLKTKCPYNYHDFILVAVDLLKDHQFLIAMNFRKRYHIQHKLICVNHLECYIHTYMQNIKENKLYLI